LTIDGLQGARQRGKYKNQQVAAPKRGKKKEKEKSSCYMHRQLRPQQTRRKTGSSMKRRGGKKKIWRTRGGGNCYKTGKVASKRRESGGATQPGCGIIERVSAFTRKGKISHPNGPTKEHAITLGKMITFFFEPKEGGHIGNLLGGGVVHHLYRNRGPIQTHGFFQESVWWKKRRPTSRPQRTPRARQKGGEGR